MKPVLLISALLTGLVSFSQQDAALQSLVNAEKTFAQTAKDKSTKEAFVTYLSDSGLIFQPGPIIGKKFWQEAAAGTEWLSWKPLFAAVSSSGDLGYTTGPWQFRPKRDDAKPAATGYFVSVWKKENNQQTGTGWKVVLDIGISFPLDSVQPETFHTLVSATNSKIVDEKMLKNELLNKEQEFINVQNNNGWSAYDKFAGADARIYRPGSFPFVSAERKNQLFSSTDKKFNYEKIGAGVASSGDLGYVYGKAIVQVIKDGETKSLDGNYLRIWKRDDAANWKIVLDLVNIAR